MAISDLYAYYKTELYGISRTVRAVDGVTFNLYPNEVYGVAGESSCGKTTPGKTTLARLLLGDQEATSGEVRFMGRPIAQVVKGKGPQGLHERGAVGSRTRSRPSTRCAESRST